MCDMHASKGVECSAEVGVEKARAIEKRHTHECAICSLIDTDNKTMKFHTYSEAAAADEIDGEICANCLNDLNEIRKRCSQKADNPNHDSFKDFQPSFVKDMPGLKDAFRKLMT